MVRYFIFGIIFLTWLASHVFFSLPDSKVNSEYIAPPEAIQYLAAGFNQQIADSLWIRAVQDFDHCSVKILENVCEAKSWLFKMLNVASLLDPFLEPVMYQTGGLALTVIISDFEGASKFFDKGVRVYPSEWKLTYAAAYHAYFEEKNLVKASRLYFQSFENGAPAWVQLMAAKLAASGGDIEFSAKVLEDMIQSNSNPAYIRRLKSKLEELKK